MTVRKTKDTMTPSLERLNRQIPKIVDEAYKHFVRITPRRSGNARRRTLKKRNQIQLRYPYAKRLDTGWSKQAPDGMSDPTLDYLKRNKKRLLRK
tara:strand:+ start:5037 stop:5321 length:285 start_codon:yes stop_codon:yes gene_type:complete